jgi:hypothetical protein
LTPEYRPTIFFNFLSYGLWTDELHFFGEEIMRRSLALFAVVLVLASGAADAAVVTFSGLSGQNGDPFVSPYNEAGLRVTTSSGVWQEAHQFGNPDPDIFSQSATAAIDVTNPGSAIFRFASVDLADALDGSATYTIETFLAGNPVYSFSGGPLPNAFVTVNSTNPLATVDLVRITMIRNSTSSYNIDNITTTAVPEPASVGLLMAIPLLLRRRQH